MTAILSWSQSLNDNDKSLLQASKHIEKYSKDNMYNDIGELQKQSMR